MTEYAKQKRYRDKLKAKALQWDHAEPRLRTIAEQLADSPTDKGKRLHTLAIEALGAVK